MLRLDLDRAARWYDLGRGVRILCDPVTTPVIAAARRSDIVQALPEGASQEELGLAMSRAVAHRVIRDWENVGDAEGRPLPVSPAGIDALLDIWTLFEGFQAAVLAGPMMVDAEKNGFAPSPNGTSAAAMPTAPAAPAGATRARPKSTRRKAWKASRSGSSRSCSAASSGQSPAPSSGST